MTRPELTQLLVSCLDAVPTSPLSDSLSFKSDLGLDSLDFLEYQTRLEDSLNLVLPDDFFDDVLTVKHLLDKLELHLKGVNYDGMRQKENDEGQGRKEKVVE